MGTGAAATVYPNYTKVGAGEGIKQMNALTPRARDMLSRLREVSTIVDLDRPLEIHGKMVNPRYIEQAQSLVRSANKKAFSKGFGAIGAGVFGGLSLVAGVRPEPVMSALNQPGPYFSMDASPAPSVAAATGFFDTIGAAVEKTANIAKSINVPGYESAISALGISNVPGWMALAVGLGATVVVAKGAGKVFGMVGKNFEEGIQTKLTPLANSRKNWEEDRASMVKDISVLQDLLKNPGAFRHYREQLNSSNPDIPEWVEFLVNSGPAGEVLHNYGGNLGSATADMIGPDYDVLMTKLDRMVNSMHQATSRFDPNSAGNVMSLGPADEVAAVAGGALSGAAAYSVTGGDALTTGVATGVGAATGMAAMRGIGMKWLGFPGFNPNQQILTQRYDRETGMLKSDDLGTSKKKR